MSSELAKIESFRKDLAIAETVEEVKLITDASMAYQELMRRQKVSTEKQNEIGIFITECMSKLGSILIEQYKYGGNRGNQFAKIYDKDLGKQPLDHNIAHKARTISGATEELKQQVIDKIIKSGDVVTTNNVFNGIKIKSFIDNDKPHVSYNSGENEWYTPKYIIDAALTVMGSIDLDPASCEIANKTVNATEYFSINDDGLQKKWFGNVWLNPPYAQPAITNFSEKVTQLEFNQACVLVNNATETVWFQNMLKLSSAVCFLKGRIKFIDKNGFETGAPLQGQCVLYFGNNHIEFNKVFKTYGICMTIIK